MVLQRRSEPRVLVAAIPKPLLAASAWVLAVIHLLGLYLPSAPETGVDLPGVDKVLHVLGFLLPTLLAVLASRRWWPVWLFALHAPASEVVQALVLRTREGDPWDVVADLGGVALAIVIAVRLGLAFPGGRNHRLPNSAAARTPGRGDRT